MQLDRKQMPSACQKLMVVRPKMSGISQFQSSIIGRAEKIAIMADTANTPTTTISMMSKILFIVDIPFLLYNILVSRSERQFFNSVRFGCDV